METKICRICGEEKTLDKYYFVKNRNKYRSECKKCYVLMRKNYEINSEINKARCKRYYERNKEKILEQHKKYNNKNKEKILERQKKYNRINQAKYKNYYKDNKDRINKKEKERLQNDNIYKLKQQVRSTLRKSFARKKYKKNGKSEKIIGCSFDVFVKHLLKTYKKNYGVEWNGIEDVHIDHIIPLATAHTEEEVIKLCHYTNLQLLKPEDNLKKQDKLDWAIKN